MKIEIHRNETSSPLTYEEAENAYTKGQMFCVLINVNGERIVHKYPLCSIFRVVESYPKRASIQELTEKLSDKAQSASA